MDETPSFDHQRAFTPAPSRAMQRRSITAPGRLRRPSALGLLQAFAPVAPRFFPSAASIFPLRCPITRWGNSFLYETTGNPAESQPRVAIHFLTHSRTRRASRLQRYCLGPILRLGHRKTDPSKKRGYSLITEHALSLRGIPSCASRRRHAAARIADEQRDEWDQIAESIARHGRADIRDFKISGDCEQAARIPPSMVEASSTRRRIGHFC